MQSSKSGLKRQMNFLPKCATGIVAEIPELQKFKIQDRKERPKDPEASGLLWL